MEWSLTTFVKFTDIKEVSYNICILKKEGKTWESLQRTLADTELLILV